MAALVVACGGAQRVAASDRPKPKPPPTSPGPPAPISASHAPACSPGRARASTDGRPGDTEDVGLLVLIRHRGSGRCSLDGVPVAVARRSSGAVVRVPRDPLTSSLPLGAGKATIGDGSTALVRLRVPAECAVGTNHAPPSYVAVTLRIAGTSQTLAHLALPARCGIYVSPYYQ